MNVIFDFLNKPIEYTIGQALALSLIFFILSRIFNELAKRVGDDK